MSLENQLSLDGLEGYLQQLSWRNRNFYRSWLAQTYYYTSHSTRLLEFCEFYASDAEAAQRYREHRQEENGHERIALSDLRRLDADIVHYGEQLSTRTFYWEQYEVIRKYGDRPFLGYVLMLEILARDHGPYIFNEVRAAYGDRSANFLKIHVEEDVDHVNSAIRLLETFTDSEKSKVLENFNWSINAYKAILDECRSSIKEAPNENLAAV
ncbi:iron-containing redox enzyme family protein [Microbulbifer sp. SAOS-129_SWC]|uniref:iron-containing redox enzyme family protein n=1 Tax=Microbulbifer sp. SAOS-129_SWC TaxID=3145235 RepID=UPI003216731D